MKRCVRVAVSLVAVEAWTLAGEAWTLAGEAWIPVEVAAPAAVRNFGRSMAFRFKGSDRALFRVDFRRVTVSTCSHLTSRILE